jgi:exosortase
LCFERIAPGHTVGQGTLVLRVLRVLRGVTSVGRSPLSQTTHISVFDQAAALPVEREREASWGGLSVTAWFQIVTVAVLMCALFRFNLARLWGKTNPFNGQDSNWQHSIFVPLIGIYYLYIHRDELLKAPVRMAWSALPIMLMGILVFLYGIYPGQNDYIKDLGMVVTVFGTVAFLAGWEVMKIAWFPIAFLVVALPWPELVYAKFAWPLQKLAASVAVGTLRVFGIEATNFGTKIAIFSATPGQPPRVLNVAEACAGLRSLMTFVMVAGTVAFLSSRAMWERLVITLSAIPIAIFCNVVRVSGQGILDHWKGPEWSEGFAHQFVGLVMLIPGFFLILLVGWILDKLFIEEVDRGQLKMAGGTGAGAARKSMSAGPMQAPPAAIKQTHRSADAVAPSTAPATATVTATASGEGAAKTVATPPASLKSAPAKPAVTKAPTVGGGGGQVAQSGGLLPSPVKSPNPATGAAGSSSGLKPSTLKPSSKPPATPAKPATGAPSVSGGLKPSAPKPRPGVQAPGLKPSASPAAKPPPLNPPAAKPPQAPGQPGAGNQSTEEGR